MTVSKTKNKILKNFSPNVGALSFFPKIFFELLPRRRKAPIMLLSFKEYQKKMMYLWNLENEGVLPVWTLEEGVQTLKNQGAKITAQRIAILKRLEGRHDHPSAEMLYKELRASFPTISFATIYGTAELLAQAGLISILTIDERHVIFDPNAAPHGHFRCTKCHHVEDLSLPDDAMSSVGQGCPHQIQEVQVFFYGTCSTCLASSPERAGNA